MNTVAFGPLRLLFTDTIIYIEIKNGGENFEYFTY